MVCTWYVVYACYIVYIIVCLVCDDVVSAKGKKHMGALSSKFEVGFILIRPNLGLLLCIPTVGIFKMYLWQCVKLNSTSQTKIYNHSKNHVNGWDLVMATLGLFYRGLYPSI